MKLSKNRNVYLTLFVPQLLHFYLLYILYYTETLIFHLKFNSIFTRSPDVPVQIQPVVLESTCFIFSCTHAPAYVQEGSGLQQRSWLLVGLENELHNTYGKSKTACNRRHLGRRPFTLKETHSCSLPLNSFAVLAHYIYGLMFG